MSVSEELYDIKSKLVLKPPKKTYESEESGYLNLLLKVLEEGTQREDRTGVGTYSLFGEKLEFDLSEYFPLLTTKKVHFKSVLGELLFFLNGGKYSKDLEDDYGVTIWREWPGDEEKGKYIPYGSMWRNFGGVDQLSKVIEDLKTNPDSRRHVVSAWNPVEMDNFALPPCHIMFQFYVESLKEGETKRRLSCQVYQRK